MSIFKGVRIAGVALFAAMAAGPALAEYPEQSVTLILPAPPGGGMDLTARLFSRYLEGALGTSVTVMNQPGGGGLLAFNAVTSAEADGYTIGLHNMPDIIMDEIADAGSETSNGFVFVGSIAEDPSVIAVSSSSDYATLDDLLSMMRATPGAVPVGTPILRSNHSLLATLIAREDGVEFVKVPFGGGGPTMSALMGGHIPAITISLGGALRGGDAVRILAQSGSERSQLAPDVPTFLEQGLDIDVALYRVIYAPEGMPAEILDTLRAAFMQAVTDPAFQEEMASAGSEVTARDGPAMTAVSETLVRNLSAVWAETPWFEVN